MKRTVKPLYGIKGYPNASRFTDFKTDLFANGDTPSIDVDTAGTNGITVSATMTAAAILLSGTAVNGVSITGVCTNGVSVSSASAVGISLSGAFTTAAIDITATAARGIRIGTKGKAADGSLPITATLPFDTDPANNYLLGVFTKVATTAAAATDDLGSAWFRTRVDVGMGTNASWSLFGAKSQLRIYASAGKATTINNWAAAGLLGVLEVSGATTTFASGAVACAGYFNVALTTTSVISAGAVVAGVVINTGSAAITDTGSAYFGLYIQDYVGGKVDFDAGIRIADSCCTTGISIGACTTGIDFVGAIATGNCINFTATCITTGSLLDYVGISGKVSGYLFNGSMTTSVLTDSTLIDDFGCSCAHDGVGADTLRMIRRTWTGALPNGTAAADFVIAEFGYSGTAGTDATKTGAVTGVKIAMGSATVNDDNLTVYGLYVDTTVTNTKSAAVHGIYVTSAEYGLSIGDECSTAINIVDASDLTNLLKFNEVAGCVGADDVACADEPSDGGLGADGHLVIDVGGAPYYIPIFNSLTT